MVQAQPKILTLEEFLKLPETKPAREYIDGKIIQKPMPQGKHIAFLKLVRYTKVSVWGLGTGDWGRLISCSPIPNPQSLTPTNSVPHESEKRYSRIQGELITAINSLVKPKKIACAFPELRCTFGGRSTIPDISVFVWNRIPCDENGEIVNVFSLTPDWTIEILSPDQSHTKVTKNILHCLKHGTQLGWLIDPEEKTVFVYHSKQEIAVFDQPEILLPVPSFVSQLNLTVNDLFAMLLL